MAGLSPLQAANTYTPLDPISRQIRLIRLYASSSKSPLTCDLIVSSLYNCSPYEALSYVWGPSTMNYYVLLDGSRLNITDNLNHCLRRLQPKAGSRLLWIDQLCINQNDKKERSHQVEIMGLIYNKAERALLWLGQEAYLDDASVSDDQLNPSRTISCTWEYRKSAALSGQYVSLVRSGTTPLNGVNLSQDYIYQAFSLVARLANTIFTSVDRDETSHIPVEETVFRTLWMLMHRPWWNRVWTVQECLTPKTSILMYGPITAPFSMFLDAGAAYSALSSTTISRMVAMATDANLQTMRHFSTTLNDIAKYATARLGDSKVDLTSILRSFRAREATDDRDKVYGFLGLNINWHQQPPLQPDYDLTVEEIYQDVTLKLIQVTQSLKVLLNDLSQNRDSRKTLPHVDSTGPLKLPFAASSELRDLFEQIETWKAEFRQAPYHIDSVQTVYSLPSWTVDWSATSAFQILPRFEQVDLYSASGDTIAEATRSEPQTLSLQGIEVDTVCWTSQIMAVNYGAHRSELFEDWYTFAADALVPKLHPSSLWHNFRDTMWRTLIGTNWKTLCSDWYTVFKDAPMPSMRPSSSQLERFQDVFWQTLCGDCILNDSTDSIVTNRFRRVTDDDFPSFLAWCEIYEPVLLPYFLPIPSDDQSGRPSDPARKKPLEVDNHLRETARRMDEAIRAATTMRRIFHTQQGRLGLGPPQTIRQEKIFVLNGGQAPFVLRSNPRHPTISQKSRYELLGDCYLHRMLDGEAFSHSERERRELRRKCVGWASVLLMCASALFALGISALGIGMLCVDSSNLFDVGAWVLTAGVLCVSVMSAYGYGAISLGVSPLNVLGLLSKGLRNDFVHTEEELRRVVEII